MEAVKALSEGLAANGDIFHGPWHERYYLNVIHIIYIYIYHIPGTQMSLVLIGKDLLLEAKQRTNGFQVNIDTGKL